MIHNFLSEYIDIYTLVIILMLQVWWAYYKIGGMASRIKHHEENITSMCKVIALIRSDQFHREKEEALTKLVTDNESDGAYE